MKRSSTPSIACSRFSASIRHVVIAVGTYDEDKTIHHAASFRGCRRGPALQLYEKKGPRKHLWGADEEG